LAKIQVEEKYLISLQKGKNNQHGTNLRQNWNFWDPLVHYGGYQSQQRLDSRQLMREKKTLDGEDRYCNRQSHFSAKSAQLTSTRRSNEDRHFLFV
jgi:hypothetical protein